MKIIKNLSLLFLLFCHTNVLSNTLNIPANTKSVQTTSDLAQYSEVQLNTNSTLDINQNFTDSYGGSLEMAIGQQGGNLTIDAAGAAITLTGDTNISGVVTIQSGALEGNISPSALLVLSPNTAYVLHADKIIRSLSGTADSVVDLGTNNLTIGRQGASVNPETYSGNITGTGGVIIEGGIQLTLNGENTYTGDTTINSGTLTTTASSLVGNITNNSNLIFNQNTNGTYTGNINGSGPVTIEGGGSITLTGTNSNTGKLTINNDGSSLIGSTSSLPGNIVNNSTNGLVFNQNTDGTYGGDISGSGKVTIEGGGVVTLTGTAIRG